jgi:threonine aldolase
MFSYPIFLLLVFFPTQFIFKKMLKPIGNPVHHILHDHHQHSKEENHHSHDHHHEDHDHQHQHTTNDCDCHHEHEKRGFNLSLPRQPVKPSEFFSQLSSLCATLGVDKSDVYGDFQESEETSPLRRFEREIAAFLHKEEALYVPSGVMAQNIVLAVTKEDSDHDKFICHHSSHLLLHENEAYSQLLGMTPLIAHGDEKSPIQHPMSYKQTFDLLHHSDKHVAAVLLEVPHREIGGKCTPYNDMLKISQLCRANNVHFHMDGARLWEATSAFDVTMHEITNLFDSVYVSFYKGLGGVTGAMLAGDSAFISKCRVWLRRFGGNVYSNLPYFVSCWGAFRENKHVFSGRKIRLLEIVGHLREHLLSKPSYNSLVDEMLMGEDESFFSEHMPFRPLIRFDPAVPEVPMVHIVIDADIVTAQQANELTTKNTGIICFRRFAPGKFANEGKVIAELSMVGDNVYIIIVVILH